MELLNLNDCTTKLNKKNNRSVNFKNYLRTYIQTLLVKKHCFISFAKVNLY